MKRVFSFLDLPCLSEKQDYPIDKHDNPPMDPLLREKLADFFRPYNQQLEEFLNMKFNWE